MNVRMKLLSVLVALIASSALAQAPRVFVASSGIDTNPCSRTSPCRNFAAAISAVADGGEVVVLDSAGYGIVSVTKSVSLIAPPGVYAGVAVPTGNGIDINAPSATVIVRGLTINGTTTSNAIVGQSVAILHVEDCVVIGAGTGVIIQSAGELFISNSLFRDGNFPIRVSPPSGAVVTGAVDHCRMENQGGVGLYVLCSTAGTKVTIRDSLFADILNDGIIVSTGEVNVKNCVFANIGVAIRAQNVAGTSVSVSDSMLVDNGTAFSNGGLGVFTTFADNALSGNGTATSGTITPGTKQ